MSEADPTEGKSDAYLALLVTLLAGFSTFPLFQPHFFASSDGLFHLYRLMEYDVILRQGVLYPRWAYDFYLGLGTPLFNYYAPLTYYLAEIPHLLGLGYIDSLKVFTALAFAASGLGAYLYARTLLSPISSLLAAAMYMYVPYHIVNLYYRADLAEYASYAWFPLILWSLSRLIERKRPIYLFLGSLFFGALILTHNLSAFLFAGFLVIYAVAALLRQHDWRRPRWNSLLADVGRLAGLAALAAGLTAFFWGPALLEKPLLTFDRLLAQFNYHEHFPTLDLLLPSWLLHRYGIVFRGSEVYGYKLGMLQVVFLLLGLVLLVLTRRRLRAGLRVEMAASLLVTALSLFLMLPISEWVWEKVPLLSLTQFPWRFLAWIALPSALMVGAAAEALSARLRPLAALGLAPLIVVASVANVLPVLSDVREADVTPRGSMAFEMTTGSIGTAAAAEYLPTWAKERLHTTPLSLEATLGEGAASDSPWLSPGMEVRETERRPYGSVYQVRAQQEGDLVLGAVYFPGWQASVDGQPVSIAPSDPYGLIKLHVAAGDHRVETRFGETRLRQAFDLASAAAGLALLAGLLLLGRRRRPALWSSATESGAAGRLGVGAEAPRTWVWRGSGALKRLLQAKGLYSIKFHWARAAQLAVVVALLPAWLVGKSLADAPYAAGSAYSTPLLIEMDRGVKIEGYCLEGAVSAPNGTARLPVGMPVSVTVYWRAPGATGERFQPSLRLTNGYNHTWAYAESAAAYPEEGATGDGLLSTTLSLVVAPYTPPGAYQLEVGLRSTRTGALLETRRSLIVPVLPGRNVARIGPVFVGRSPTHGGSLEQALTGSVLPGPVNFADRLRLLRLALADGEASLTGRPGSPLPSGWGPGSWRMAAGETIHLDLLWQGLGPQGKDYTVTARLIGGDGSLWSVRDAPPTDGNYPTSLWAAGEVVRDQMNLAVPPETAPGSYDLALEVVTGSGSLSIMDENHAPTGPTLRIGRVEVLPAQRPADLKTVKTQRSLDQAWPAGLHIYGYGLGGQTLPPGGKLGVEMIWGAEKATGADYWLRLSLVDQSGQARGSAVVRPVGDTYPTSVWREGEVLRGRYSVPLEATASEGDLAVIAELLPASGDESLARLELGRVQVQGRPRIFAASPTHPLQAELGGQVRLLGFEWSAEGGQGQPAVGLMARPGSTVKIAPYWQAMVEKMAASYTVSIQVLNPEGRLVTQHDSPPRNGEAPTTGWLLDEVVADEHALSLPADLPAGDYTIIAVVYDPASGQRLRGLDGKDFVVLAPLRLVAGDQAR